MKKLIILTSALAMLGACEKDNVELASAVEGAVSFSSASISRATDELWTAGDEIGVFAYKGGAAYDNYENIAYETTVGGQEAAFTPSGGTTIFYPTNGDKLSFKAYSPYQSAASSGVYAINVSEQSNPALIDLIVADNGVEYDKSSANASLTFYHKLSKLTMTLEAGVGLEASDLVGATVELRGVTSEGAYSLNDNNFTYEPATSNITARTISDGVSYDAILLPSTSATFDVVFTLTNGKSYTWKVENKTFTSGMNQSYTITVEESEITVSSATLSGWGLNSSEELTAEELIPIVSTTIDRPDTDRIEDCSEDAPRRILEIGGDADFAIEANYDSNNDRRVTVKTNYKTEFNNVYPACAYSTWEIETVSGEPTDTYVNSFTQGNSNDESTVTLRIGTVRGQIKLKVTTSHFDTSIYPNCATVTDEVLITITDIYSHEVLVTELANGVYEATPIPYYANVKKIRWEAELSYDDSTTESLSQAATGTDSDLAFYISSEKNGSAKIVAIAEDIYDEAGECKSKTLNTTFTTTMWDGTTIATTFESGAGTDTEPYIITNGAQLAFLAQEVNAGEDYEGEYFKLLNNIDLNDQQWTPIGMLGAEFKGTFDGNGKTISGLYISASTDNQALFGVLGGEGTVKNLTVEGSVNTSANYAAGVVASNYGSITMCINKVTVSSSASYAGGITATNSEGSISCCGNEASISSTSFSGQKIGGIAGEASGNIDACYNYGNISNSYGYSTGGIVGYGYNCVINNCYNSASINCNKLCGGIANFVATLTSCYNVGIISTHDNESGAVIGAQLITNIYNCYYLDNFSKGWSGGSESGFTIEITEKTESEMKASDFITALGSSFKVDYDAPNQINNGYPVLYWQ